jgi:hypothetical protein
MSQHSHPGSDDDTEHVNKPHLKAGVAVALAALFTAVFIGVAQTVPDPIHKTILFCLAGFCGVQVPLLSLYSVWFYVSRAATRREIPAPVNAQIVTPLPAPPVPNPDEVAHLEMISRQLSRLNDIQLLAVAKLLKYATLNGDGLTHWMLQGGVPFGSELERKKFAATIFEEINELTSLLDRDEGDDPVECWRLRDPQTVRAALPEILMR